ncbi:MAG: hypothetical protein IPK26_05115 [Planctomycetes bacterium]|nr:hypothetical protein [Planctomycetota bacterium]
MNDLQRRSALYAPAGLLLAGLCYGGFVYRAEPDVGTLLSAANMQLRMAHGLPVADKNGQPLDVRVDLIAQAWANLQRAEAQAPGMAVTAEFVGFAQHLRGEHTAAAASYRRARACADVQPQQRDGLVFNEARMLAAAGRHAEALAVLDQHGGQVAADLRAFREVECAALLRELGRRDEAVARLQTAMADRMAAPMAWLQAGLEFERLGDVVAAASALQQAQAQVPIADYHLARLKLRAGEVENSIELLARACAAAPAEVRRLLREEADAWQVLAGDARFQELASPALATPSGR